MERAEKSEPSREPSEGPDPGQHIVSELSLWHSLREFPAFRTLFASTLATNSGFWMWIIATGWLALILTDSPFFVGLVGFAGGIPTLLFGLFVGVLVDRFSRRTLLLVAQCVIAVVAVILSLLLFFDMLQPWQLVTGTFINGTFMSIVFPTRNAMVANLVPSHHLANAIALNAAGQNATRVVGPALAGPLIALIGIEGTFAVCAILQLLALVITLRLPALPAVDGAVTSMMKSLSIGLATVWRSDYLLGMIIMAAIPTLFLMPYINLMPVFARDVLGLGSGGLGILMAANGFGAVIGSLYVAAARSLTTRPNVLIVSGCGFALVIIMFAITPNPWLAGVFILAAGFTSAVFLAVNNTLIQLHVEDAVRGRVIGIYVLTWGLLPIGTLPAGAIAGAINAPAALTIMAVAALLITALVAVRFPSVRRAPPEAEPHPNAPAARMAGQ